MNGWILSDIHRARKECSFIEQRQRWPLDSSMSWKQPILLNVWKMAVAFWCLVPVSPEGLLPWPNSPHLSHGKVFSLLFGKHFCSLIIIPSTERRPFLLMASPSFQQLGLEIALVTKSQWRHGLPLIRGDRKTWNAYSRCWMHLHLCILDLHLFPPGL